MFDSNLLENFFRKFKKLSKRLILSKKILLKFLFNIKVNLKK